MATLWHVHSLSGNCNAVTIDYETAIQLCIQFYEESQKCVVFYATQETGARLNTRPLPNS